MRKKGKMRLISSGRNGKEDERRQEERKARFEEKEAGTFTESAASS